MTSLCDLIADLPVPSELASDRITHLLAKAITEPATLVPREIKEIAVSAAFYLVTRPKADRSG